MKIKSNAPKTTSLQLKNLFKYEEVKTWKWRLDSPDPRDDREKVLDCDTSEIFTVKLDS